MTTDRKISGFAKDHFYHSVGGAIQRARFERDMSLDQVAKGANLTKVTIQNAEYGATCSLLVLTRIAHALDVTVDELIPLDALK